MKLKSNKINYPKTNRHIPADFAYDVASLQEVEALVQFNIVNVVVIALGEHQLVRSWRIFREPVGRGKHTWQPIELRHERVFLGSACRVGHENVMRLKHTVHNGNFRIRDLVHCYVTSLIPCVGRVGQEEKVTTVERGFHGATGFASVSNKQYDQVETRTSERQRWVTRC